MARAKTYLLLTGARANVGDHLIRQRVRELLHHVHPDSTLIEVDRSEPLDARLDEVNGCDAVLLAGGPGLQSNAYPGVYRLAADLPSVTAPIIGLGVGTKRPAGRPGRIRFTRSARLLLGRLAAQGRPVSCRDEDTAKELNRAGIVTAMTGDPAWYDLTCLRKDPSFLPAPSDVRTVLLSTAASPAYVGQTAELVAQLRTAFPEATVRAAFHHGWRERPGVGASAAAGWAQVRDRLVDLGVACMDLAANLPAMEEAYATSDLHVGYRLHGHLLRVSRRTPSLLLHEDGRGAAASASLGVPGVQAWVGQPLVSIATKLGVRRATPGLPAGVGVDPKASALVVRLAQQEHAAGWPSLRHGARVIDSTFVSAMRPFLEGLP